MITESENSPSKSNRPRYLKVATTVFVTTILTLFLYYLRRSRPEDPSMRELTSIGLGVTLILAVLYPTIKLYLVPLYDKASNTVHSDYEEPKTQTGVKLVHRVFLLTWFCFLFIVHKMNLPLRDVSTWVIVVLCVLAASAIGVGFVMRRRFFKLMTEVLPHDPDKARQFWTSANLISFCCALNPAIYGVMLKIAGSGWLVPGILFSLGLGFLLLWRPRQLSASGVQPA